MESIGTLLRKLARAVGIASVILFIVYFGNVLFKNCDILTLPPTDFLSGGVVGLGVALSLYLLSLIFSVLAD